MTEAESLLEPLETMQPLQPFKYPKLIHIVGVIVLGLLLYSFYIIPPYFAAAANLKRGEDFLNQRNYSEAIMSFKKAVDQVPSSVEAKVLISIAIFSDNDLGNDMDGIYYLQYVYLDDSDWTKVSAVMPEEYKGFFNTITE